MIATVPLRAYAEAHWQCAAFPVVRDGWATIVVVPREEFGCRSKTWC
jgi:hypothetical protein